MSDKKMLNESAIRKMMKLANIPALSDKFIQENYFYNIIEKTLSTLTTRWFTDNFINHNKNIVKRRLKQVIETDPEVFLNVFLMIYMNNAHSTLLKKFQAL